MCGNMGGGGSSSTSTQSSTKPITYASPSEKDQMKRDITNQFFDNYRKYGADGEKANKMIIDRFLKEGFIDNEMAESLRKTDRKVKKLEVNAPKSNELQKRAEQAEKRIAEQKKIFAEKNANVDKKASERNKRMYEEKVAERESAKQKQEAIKQRNKEREQWREETNKLINEARKKGTLSQLLKNDKTAGINTTLPATTSTYKRYIAKRRKIKTW